MDWIYKRKKLTEIPDGYVGFVYILTLPDGTKYIGKKSFIFKKYKQVKGKRKAIKVPSDWEDYYGSSDYFNELVDKVGKDKVIREILHLCKTKAEMSYLETWEIFKRHALLTEEYANGWVSNRTHKKHVLGKINPNDLK